MINLRQITILIALLTSIMAPNSSLFASPKPIVITPEKIIVTTDGLFVNVNEELLPVDTVFAANDGYYVAFPQGSSFQIRPSWPCPRCGFINYHLGKCKRCSYPDGEID